MSQKDIAKLFLPLEEEVLAQLLPSVASLQVLDEEATLPVVSLQILNSMIPCCNTFNFNN